MNLFAYIIFVDRKPDNILHMNKFLLTFLLLLHASPVV